jgi:hypothetical protein
MTTPPDPDSVEPALRRAEVDLAHHLDEACEEAEKDFSQESLDELLRLEDELLAAADAARKAVRLRQNLGERPSKDVERAASASAAQSETSAEEPPPCRVREFRDRTGREWRVWQVIPGSTGRAANPARYLGEYVKGWLAFELLHGDVRKRLPSVPSDWLQMSDEELDRLLPQAVEVRRRPRPQPDTAESLQRSS